MKIRKIIFGIGIVLLLIGSLIVKAQEDMGSTKTILTNDLFGDISPDTLSDIHKIGIKYCNKEIKGDTTNSYLTINMRPGEVKNLCVAITNNSENYHDMVIGFTEAVINNVGKQLCKGDLSDKQNSFAKMIDLKYTNISLSGNGGIFMQIARIRAPKNITGGDILGCLGIWLSGAYFKGSNNNLGVKVTRNFPLKITVTGDVYNFGRRDDIKYAYTDNQSMILKIIILILIIWIIVTIVQMTKKKPNPHKKK